MEKAYLSGKGQTRDTTNERLQHSPNLMAKKSVITV